MYQALREVIDRPLSGRILGISGIRNFDEFIDGAASEVVDVQYPEVDMQDLPYAAASFDVVISDQVIEHIPRPFKAVQETFRVLRPGGLAIHTTCFLNPLHPSPGDFFRFTPDGLRAICSPHARVIAAGSWGNRVALVMLTVRDRWRFLEIPSRSGFRHWVATFNEDKWGIATWVVAQKSDDI